MLPDDVLLASLHQHTEGWPVGIRLAALALRSQSDYGEFAAHFKDAGSRYIGDYLVDEVLDHQPLPVQRFLILTALLDRFCAGLCAAVAEIDERSAAVHRGSRTGEPVCGGVEHACFLVSLPSSVSEYAAE